MGGREPERGREPEIGRGGDRQTDIQIHTEKQRQRHRETEK